MHSGYQCQGTHYDTEYRLRSIHSRAMLEFIYSRKISGNIARSCQRMLKNITRAILNCKPTGNRYAYSADDRTDNVYRFFLPQLKAAPKKHAKHKRNHQINRCAAYRLKHNSEEILGKILSVGKYALCHNSAYLQIAKGSYQYQRYKDKQKYRYGQNRLQF